MANEPTKPLPCARQAAALRQAIDEWVKASEETRKYMVRMPLQPEEELAPLHPGFFREMQAAYEHERLARTRYIEANNALYKCMAEQGLVD